MSTRSKDIITIEGLDIGYPGGRKGPVSVLKGISANLPAGSFTGLIASNGTGKSTLLRTLNGLLTPLAGHIQLNGRALESFDRAALAREIAVVLTDKVSGFNLRVYDVVASGRTPYMNAFGKIEAADHEIILRSVDLCGLSPYLYKAIDELSDGLRQKCMIAKSLAQQTPVVLLDEPTAFLDFASRHQIFRLLKQCCTEEHKCILLSSHDLEFVLDYCDAILLLSSDNKHLFGQKNQIVNTPQFEVITGGYKF